jgi:putative inorganic carbon (HCO3(-)) transporter
VANPRFLAPRLAAIELGIVAALVLSGVIVQWLLPAAPLAFLVFRLFEWVMRRRSARPLQPAQPPLILRRARFFSLMLLFMLGVTSLITAFPETTQPQVWRTLGGMALCFSIVGWLRTAGERLWRVRLLMAAIMLVGAGLALAAPFIVDWTLAAKTSLVPASIYSNFRLLLSDSVNTNVMAGALVVLLPLPLAVLLFDHPASPAWYRATAVITLVIMGVILLLAQSRSAWFAFVVALAVVLMVRWRRLMVPALVAAVIVMLLIVLNAPLRDQIVSSFAGGSQISGLDQRIEIWTRGWYMVQDFMFTGIGMGSFQQVTELLYPLIITPASIPHAHNLFLQVAVDLGIPGLIAWFGILMNVILACFTLIRKGEPLLRATGAGLLASNVALCVHGLTDAVTWGMVRTAPLVWALWGLAIGASLLCAPLKQKTAPPSAETPLPAPPAPPPPQPSTQAMREGDLPASPPPRSSPAATATAPE